MTTRISITLPLPAYGWPMPFALMAASIRVAVDFTKRNQHHAQGCLPMTD